MNNNFVLLLLCVVPLSSLVNSSHFRGATFSWKWLGEPNNIEIKWRISWRRGRVSCSQSIIINSELIGESGYFLNCETCSNITNIPLKFYCTDFSEDEDWSTGVNSVEVEEQNSAFNMKFTGRDWISSIVGRASRWSFLMSVNLTTRSEISRPNSSPSTSILPIIRLKHGCRHTISIPVDDPDGDIIRCRWATGYDECGTVCHSDNFNAYLDQNACKIDYEASSTGWFAVALMIEDFSTSRPTTPLSKIPLQFLVVVSQSSGSCNTVPQFVNPTPGDGTSVNVPLNETYFMQIVVYIENATKENVFIETVSPRGFLKSKVAELDGRPYHFYVNISWEPQSDQLGDNIFCFEAFGGTGRRARSCIIVVVVASGVPNIVCPDDVYDSPGYVHFNVSATDKEGDVDITCDHLTGSLFDSTKLVTCIANDTTGNRATCSFNVVIDKIAPVINCTIDQITSIIPLVYYSQPIAVDDLSETTVDCFPVSGSRFSIGSTTIACTARDGANNTASCSFAVNVSSEVPNIVCPEGHLYNSPEYVRFNVSATDKEGDVDITCDHLTGSLFNDTTLVTCVANDTTGNRANCSFIVTIDNEAPIITFCPLDAYLFADMTNKTAVAIWNSPAATDNSGVPPYITTNIQQGDLLAIGNYLVSVTVKDSSGNINSSCSFNLNVIGFIYASSSVNVIASSSVPDYLIAVYILCVFIFIMSPLFIFFCRSHFVNIRTEAPTEMNDYITAINVPTYLSTTSNNDEAVEQSNGMDLHRSDNTPHDYDEIPNGDTGYEVHLATSGIGNDVAPQSMETQLGNNLAYEHDYEAIK